MYIIKRDKKFIKIAQKFLNKNPNLNNRFKEVIYKLQENPFDNSLKTHKLHGELNGKYSCSLNYEYRIVLTIEIRDKEIYLIDIGTHDEVY